MNVFIWKAVSKTGAVAKGDMVAESEPHALAKLRKQGYREILIRKRTQKGGLFKGRGVREEDMVIYLRQLSVMVNAGLPLMTCFSLVGRGSDKILIHQASIRIREAIELGNPLSKAMEKEGPLFDAFTRNLIQVAEKSGVLNTVLDRLATYKEKSFLLKGKIKSALTYPIMVIVIALMIFALLMVKVVPVFVSLYDSFGSELPGPTQTIIAISDFMQAWWWVLLIGSIAGLKIISIFYQRNERFQYQMDSWAISVPLLGDILRKAAMARFARSFSTMLAAGTPIMECLEAVAKTSGNKVLERITLNAKTTIMEGHPLSESLEESDFFPAMVTQMIFTGETAGNLDFMLNKVADFYDAEIDRVVDNFRAVMEPLIMVLLGLMIGGIVLGMYLPLLKMGGFVG